MVVTKKDITDNKNFQKLADWTCVWGVVPGTKWYWPSAAFFVGMWVSFAVLLVSYGIPYHDMGAMLFAICCLIGAAVNFLIFWVSDAMFRSDKERARKIKAGWGSDDPAVRYTTWGPL